MIVVSTVMEVGRRIVAMAKTGINWCTHVVNLVGGCTHCSPGCDHCWAAKVASTRLKDHPLYKGLTTAEGRWTGEIRLTDKPIVMPGGKPKEIFVQSMGDLFHGKIPAAMVRKIFQAMYDQPQNRYLLLTKRAGEMDWQLNHRGYAMPPNIFFGLTICNQKEADEKLPIFMQIPGKKFLSIEPLLEPIDLRYEKCDYCNGTGTEPEHPDIEPSGETTCMGCGGEAKSIPSGIGQVILGGESGPGARPMHPDWVRSIRDQCKAANVPFFFKQWGDHRKDLRIDGVLYKELIWR